MHPYEFLQRYGPTALVLEVTADAGEAFAAELAKNGFDLVLPCSDARTLAPLKARFEDHEGIKVDLLEGDLDNRHFAENLYPHCEPHDIGLIVCGIEAGHPRQAGSLISSLTRVFMPRLRTRQHSGVLVVDLTGKAQRLGETLAHELRPEDIDVLTVCVDQGLGDMAPRAFARQALDHMDQGPILTL